MDEAIERGELSFDEAKLFHRVVGRLSVKFTSLERIALQDPTFANYLSPLVSHEMLAYVARRPLTEWMETRVNNYVSARMRQIRDHIKAGLSEIKHQKQILGVRKTKVVR